jgi:hypothetical protein
MRKKSNASPSDTSRIRASIVFPAAPPVSGIKAGARGEINPRIYALLTSEALTTDERKARAEWAFDNALKTGHFHRRGAEMQRLRQKIKKSA